MDALKRILYFQWKSYWRSFTMKRKSQRRFFLLMFIFIPFYIGLYAKLLKGIAGQIASGSPMQLEQLLVGTFLAWMLLPLMTDDSYLDITAKTMNRYPMRRRKLFLLECTAILIQPITWALILITLSILFPLCASQIALLAVPAGILFLFFCFFFAVCLKNYFYQSPGIRKLPAFVSVVLIAVAMAFTDSFTYPEISASLFRYLPTRLPVNIALNRLPFLWLTLLVALTVLAAFLAFKSLENYLATEKKARGKGKVMLKFSYIPGKLSGLVQKDFYYFLHNTNIYLALGIIALYLHYLLTIPVPSPDSAFIVMLFIFVPNLMFSLNCFGLDAHSNLNLYILFPLKGRQILLSKNIAFVFLLVFQTAPMFIILIWKLGFHIFLLAFLEMMTIILLQVIWGNIISILNPVPMQFNRLNLLPMQAAINFIISVIILHAGVFFSIDRFRENPAGALGKQLIAMGIVLFAYLITLYVSGRKLEKNIRHIRNQLK
ncbi:MAG: hypothetical protein GY765_18180 [bacterium]|nr:hypothetical protein [bacterium]